MGLLVYCVRLLGWLDVSVGGLVGCTLLWSGGGMVGLGCFNCLVRLIGWLARRDSWLGWLDGLIGWNSWVCLSWFFRLLVALVRLLSL